MSSHSQDETSPRPSALLALPNEIKMEIAEHLCPHCVEQEWPNGTDDASKLILMRALSALSKTCKAWQSIAQPVLFHHYACPDNSKVCLEQTINSVGLFGRTLSQRPDLGAAVQALTCPTSGCVMYAPGSSTRIPGQIRRIAALHNMTIPEDKEDPLFTEFLTNILLKYTPNVRHVAGDIFGTQALVAPTSQIRRLESLKLEYPPGLSSQLLRDFLSATLNIRSLVLRSLEIGFDLQSLSVVSVKQLAITGSSSVEVADVHRLLAAFPNVEDIFCGSLHFWSTQTSDYGISRAEFSEVIASIPMPPLLDDRHRPCLDNFIVIESTKKSESSSWRDYRGYTILSRRHTAKPVKSEDDSREERSKYWSWMSWSRYAWKE